MTGDEVEAAQAILSGEDVLVYAPAFGTGGQQVRPDPGVTVYSQALGVGVVVRSERSQHKCKAEGLRLLRVLADYLLKEREPVAPTDEQDPVLAMLDEAMDYADRLEVDDFDGDTGGLQGWRALRKAYRAHLVATGRAS